MCGNLAGNMCSLKPRVKCGYNRVDFLDAKGAVIAIGDEVTQKICYEAGPRKGVCKEAPLVVTAPPEPSPSSAGKFPPICGAAPLVTQSACDYVLAFVCAGLHGV